MTTMILEVQRKVDEADYKLNRLDKDTQSFSMKINTVAMMGT